MHDLDRQQLEYEDDGIFGGSRAGELGMELTQAQEMALASEFLEVASDAELEEFLGALWNRTKAAATTAYNSPTVRKAIPALKKAGRYFLPAAADMVGDRLLPGTGPMFGAGAQWIADQVLPEELEGLSAEDREFETARSFVRYANEALQRAAQTPDRVPPTVAAQVALRDAARTTMPGLVPLVPALFRSANGGSRSSNPRETSMSIFEASDSSQEYGYESEYEGPFEMDGSSEFEGEFGGLEGALSGEAESPLSDAQEMELAAELLEITSEEELEEFLGNLVKGVAKGVGTFVRSPIGKQLGGVLKSVAKKALPMVGGALGSMVLPGVGTALGGQLGSMASKLFELEAEGMSQDELEFEMARRYVRLAATSAEKAALAPRSAPPRRVVQAAVTQAARQHAPGLLRGGAAPGGRRPGSQGRGRPGLRPGQGAGGRRPGGRPAPLGAVAFPVGSTNVHVTGGNGGSSGQAAGQQPSYGPPEWSGSGSSDDDDDGGQGSGQGRSGRWYRRGRKIVLVGI